MDFFDKELCALCGGECCLTSGCLISTRDCNMDIKKKLSELISQNIVTLYVIPTKVFLQLITRSIYKNYDGDLIKIFEKLVSLTEDFAKIEENEEVYVLKMRSGQCKTKEYIKSLEKDLERFVTPGKCVKLTLKGCEYSDAERPFGGVALIPKVSADGRKLACKMEGYSVMIHVMEWLPYHEIIWRLFT